MYFSKRAKRLQPWVQSSLGFALLAGLLLPLVWLRASPESSLWIDEIHSLQLSQLEVPRLLDESARDFHPPGYPLALKIWLKAGRLAGFEPGIVWARALNVVVWLFVAAASWFLGSFLLGRSGGALLTVCVAGSSAAVALVRDLRSYAFVFGALFLAVLLLTALRSAGRAARWELALWTGYTAALSAALWSHLLAAPAVALLSLTWLVFALSVRRGEPRWRIAYGLAAHLVPWLLFLPWLLQIPGQLARLRQAAPEWMTPPSLANLLRVFDWWLPLGRISPPSSLAEPWLTGLGTLAVVVPLAVGLRAWTTGGGRGVAATLSWLALPSAAGSILLFWLLARLEVAPTFHGPRYPLLVAGMFAAGLVGAALSGTRSLTHSSATLSLWLLAAVVGQVMAIGQESTPGGLAAFRVQVEELTSGPGSKIYVTPSELAPFIRQTFTSFDLRPVEEVVCSPPAHAVILDVNPWPALDRTRDQVLTRAILSGALSATVDRRDWQDAQTAATLYRLDEIDPKLARDLCDRGLTPLPKTPSDSVASATSEDQLAGDGWSYLEFDEALGAWRWGTLPEVYIRFDRVVLPGDYLLHLKGVRHPYPERIVAFRMEMEGGALRAELPLGPGPIEIVLPVTLERPRRPVLRISHPVWSPAVAMGSNDTRQLSFLFEAAWLTPDLPSNDASGGVKLAELRGPCTLPNSGRPRHRCGLKCSLPGNLIN